MSAAQAFYNLPREVPASKAAAAAAAVPETSSAGASAPAGRDAPPAPPRYSLQTNWSTFEDQAMTSETLRKLFMNEIPLIREEGFLTRGEAQKMLECVKTQQMWDYDLENTWPRLRAIGITHFDYINDQDRYLSQVEAARDLQNMWKAEAGVDIVGRIAERLERVSGIRTRVAREGDREYFAGLVRASDKGMAVHADWAPYETSHWSVGAVQGQLSWNILLNSVPGGETLIYDRQWRAPDDDLAYRKTQPSDTYHKRMLQGRSFKVMEPVQGDLTMFCPRNFHEVMACDTWADKPVADLRFSISSFVGFVPGDGERPDELVLWS